MRLERANNIVTIYYSEHSQLFSKRLKKNYDCESISVSGFCMAKVKSRNATNMLPCYFVLDSQRGNVIYCLTFVNIILRGG